MSETIDQKLLDINDKVLSTRINFLQGRLLEAAKTLRSQIPNDMSDTDLREDGYFRQWVVCNTVYDSSIRDNNNEGFNRMLFYMFEESGGNVPRLLSHYDIKIDLDDNGALENIELIILETETSSE